jgi:hypothetical protein
MKTLVARGMRTIDGKRYAHGAEIPPGLLPAEAVDWMLDNRELTECDASERRSLYRLFASFSGCTETESLTQKEIDELALT